MIYLLKTDPISHINKIGTNGKPCQKETKTILFTFNYDCEIHYIYFYTAHVPSKFGTNFTELLKFTPNVFLGFKYSEICRDFFPRKFFQYAN